MTRTELVMNELMGSTANAEFERRIAASWCGSRVAGWRIVVVKTSVSLVDKASLASKAPLVSLDTKWNVTCIMQMTVTHRKRETNVMLVTAVLASMVSLAPMASMVSMVMASMASRASIVGVTLVRWRILRSETLVNAPKVLAVMRWILNSGEILVVFVLGQNTPTIWRCLSTKLAWEADGSRSSRRVDDVKVEKELMGCLIWAMVVTMAWVATMASMASMVWIARGGVDVEAPLVLMVVATNGGVDGWRRWMASMVGVYGGNWVFDTEGTDVEVPLCPQQ